MVKTKSKEQISEVRVYGVSTSVATDLENIAGHLRVNRSDLIKIELRKLRDSYPEYMRVPKKKEQDD